MKVSTAAHQLALSVLEGPWNRQAIESRLTYSLPTEVVRVEQLAFRLWYVFKQPPHRRIILTEFLLADPYLENYWRNYKNLAPVKITLNPSATNQTLLRQKSESLPSLDTSKDLCEFLAISPKELEWLADRRGLQALAKTDSGHHYRYRLIVKPSGGLRLIETPKPLLKRIQRQINQTILANVPSHPNSHGYVRGRSCRSFVQHHVGQHLLIRFDLQDFFSTVPTSRIFRVFHALGYPQNVCDYLVGLTTHASSANLIKTLAENVSWQFCQQLKHKHLAQGAPTSPSLANFSAYRLDCRLQGLAERYQLEYSRYCDDLAFSGATRSSGQVQWIKNCVAAICLEEGFRLNYSKTKTSTQSQQQKLTGIVLNQKINIDRKSYDQLKAILTNCIRFGPSSQNRQGLEDFKAHLWGRVTYVKSLNESKGAKLETLFNKIVW